MSVLRELLHVGGLTVEEIDLRTLSDENIAALNAWENVMSAESHPDDPPEPVEMTAANVRNIPNYQVVKRFWGRDAAGAIAASAGVRWTTLEQNTHLVHVWIGVRADHRRRGIGRELLRLVADATEAEGRTLLIGTTSDRVPAGGTFAERVGAEAAINTHTNRLLIADVDRDRVRTWVEHGPARAEGYSLVAVDGPHPDDLIGDVVRVYDVMNTAPRENLDMEDEPTTVEMVREWEKGLFAAKAERWSLFARHEASGELIGYTEVAWFPSHPQTVWQFGTAVRPDHRGHALGKWMKAAMLDRVMRDRPGVVDVRTGNADSNDAMLGINHALGFEPYIAEIGWQITVDAVRAYLSGSST